MYRVLFIILISFAITLHPAMAQTPSIEITPVSNSYQVKGNLKVTATNNRYTVEGIITDLPQAIPNNAQFYILWATVTDGRADNLGAISNSTNITANIIGKPTQFFITAERQRFPEFVEGPKLAQSKQLTDADLPKLSSPSPSIISSPQPVGQPTDAPETGMGGMLIFYTLSGTMILGGTIGAFRSKLAKT